MEIRAACHAQSDGLCYTWNHAEWLLNIDTCLFVLSKKHFLWRLVNSGSTSQHYHVKFFCLLNWMLVTSDDRVLLEHSLAYYCTPLPLHNGHFLLSQGGRCGEVQQLLYFCLRTLGPNTFEAPATMYQVHHLYIVSQAAWRPSDTL